MKTETKICIRKGQIIKVKDVPAFLPLGTKIYVNICHLSFFARLFRRPKWKYSTANSYMKAIVIGTEIEDYDKMVEELKFIIERISSKKEKDEYSDIIRLITLEEKKAAGSKKAKKFDVTIPDIDKK